MEVSECSMGGDAMLRRKQLQRVLPREAAQRRWRAAHDGVVSNGPFRNRGAVSDRRRACKGQIDDREVITLSHYSSILSLSKIYQHVVDWIDACNPPR